MEYAIFNFPIYPFKHGMSVIILDQLSFIYKNYQLIKIKELACAGCVKSINDYSLKI